MIAETNRLDHCIRNGGILRRLLLTFFQWKVRHMSLGVKLISHAVIQEEKECMLVGFSGHSTPGRDMMRGPTWFRDGGGTSIMHDS
jgi:hypothetical protein